MFQTTTQIWILDQNFYVEREGWLYKLDFTSANPDFSAKKNMFFHWEEATHMTRPLNFRFLELICLTSHGQPDTRKKYKFLAGERS